MKIDNLEVGGDCCLHGNISVEGWLDAPNVKGFLRGLFPDTDALRRYAPRPRSGWAALVGLTLPAEVYEAVDGVWTATGRMGGQPLLDASPVGDALIIEERTRRQEGDERLAQLLTLMLGYRQATPQWELRKYVSLQNREEEQAGYRQSSPITLVAGESIAATLDTGGEAFPIAVVAPDQVKGWYDFPAIADDFSAGRRRYEFHAEVETEVVISCLGEAEVSVWRPREALLLTALYGVNGKLTSGTRRQMGGLLLADGTLSNVIGYGVTQIVRVSHLRRICYEGNLVAPTTGGRAFVIFYDVDGAIVESHYCGEEMEGARFRRREGGAVRLQLAVPVEAATARFCSGFDGRFRVTGGS